MPEWNQSPGGSTPSLDDVLEKIQLKLKGFKGVPALILVAVMVVVTVLWTAWFTVQPEETGIVQRFGKVMRTAGPGLHFKLPFNIEKVRLLPTARVLKEEFGFRTVATVPGEKTRYDPSGSYKNESLMPRAFTAKLTTEILNSMPSCVPLKATKRKRIRIPC
jgi:membrane protease subunit HflK